MLKNYVAVIVLVLFLVFRKCDGYSHCGRKRSTCSMASGSVIPERELKKHLGKVFQLPSVYAPRDRTRATRCHGSEVWLDKKDGTLVRRDSCFIAVAGLAGRGVSIKSANNPNHYLRCKGGLCYIEVSDGSDLFRYDATFVCHKGVPTGSRSSRIPERRPLRMRRPGTQKSTYSVSFESVTHPGFYIIHDPSGSRRGSSRVRLSRFRQTKRFGRDALWDVIENNKAVTSAYRSVGCWKDRSRSRAISTLEGKDSRLNGFFRRRTHAIQKCYQAAKARGYRYFAVQHGGWCASSATAGQTYRRYGRSNGCRGGKGAFNANDVYIIKGTRKQTRKASKLYKGRAGKRMDVPDSRQSARNKLIGIIGKALEDEQW